MKTLVSLTTLLVLAGSGLADDSHNSSFGEKIRVPTNVGFSTNVSDDGQVATVLFDNVSVEVNGPRQGQSSVHNQTAIDTKLVTLNFPYKTDQRSIDIAIDVRGFVDVDAGTNARLILCCGETTKVLNLTSKENDKRKRKDNEEETEDAVDDEEGDFFERVSCRVQTHADEPVCQLTLVLIADQDTDHADSGGGMLQVDSLDVTLGKGGKAKLR